VLMAEVLDANGMVRGSYLLDNPGANDPALLARLYPLMNNIARTATSSIDLRGSRELFALPGGALAVSLGAELRHESFDAVPDTLFSDGSISLFGITGSTGSRNVSAAYGELVAPLLKTVELNLAARADHYKEFGTAVTPKLGLKWSPLPQLAFRSTYSEGFRAPSLPEVNAGTTNGYLKVRDPRLCPNFSTENVNCERYVSYSSGRNPDIKAEESKSVTVGVVIEPVPRWSLSLDAYSIKRRNELTTISSAYLLDHEGDYADRIQRSAISGQLEHLDLATANLAQTETRGLDLDARGSLALGDWGRLTFNGSYNRMFSFQEASSPDADKENTVGYYLKPKHRARAGVAWDRGPWTASVNWSYTGAYLTNTTPAATCSFEAATPWYCTVHAGLTANAYVAYSGVKNLQLALSVQNLANKEAPFDASQLAYLQGYNPAYHSQLGRYVQLSATYNFK
jgi:iron complex outermembrane receptor protein